jgi:hypothetical protein
MERGAWGSVEWSDPISENVVRDWQMNSLSQDKFDAVRLCVDELAKSKLDRTHFSVAGLNDFDEKAYWLSKSPAERLEALELMRQMIYGYDPTRTRLQRILTVVSLADLKTKRASGPDQDIGDLEKLP